MALIQPSQRWRFGARVAGWHAALSAVIAVFVCWQIFGVWYRYPFAQMLGVNSLIAMLIGIDLVCGPLLNFFLSNPKKTKKALFVDWTLIGFIQFSALIYGMHSLWEARPVMMVFERDRLVVVTANEIYQSIIKKELADFQKIPNMTVRLAATREPHNTEERLKSLDLSLQGIEPSARPDWWIPYHAQDDDIRNRSKPLSELILHRPSDKARLAAQELQLNKSENELRYLPFTSRKTMDWIALLDAQTLMPVAYAPIDGF